MKRIISILLTLLCLTAIITPLTAFAAKDEIVVAEGLESLSFDGKEYLLFDGRNATALGLYRQNRFKLTLPANETEIVNYEMYYDIGETVFQIDYVYKNGSVLTCYYLRTDYVSIFEEEAQSDKFKVNFYYPYNNTVTGTLDELMGEALTLSYEKLRGAEEFDVYSDGRYDIHYGFILYTDGEFYFASPTENNGATSFWDMEEVFAHKIKSPALEDKLRDAIDEYYSTDYGYVNDENFVNTFSTVFLLLVFAFVPFCIMVLALVFIIAKNSRYKRVYAFVLSVSALLLAVVSLLAAIFISTN